MDEAKSRYHLTTKKSGLHPSSSSSAPRWWTRFDDGDETQTCPSDHGQSGRTENVEGLLFHFDLGFLENYLQQFLHVDGGRI